MDTPDVGGGGGCGSDGVFDVYTGSHVPGVVVVACCGCGGTDVTYDTCLCRYAPTHATNSGGRTPGSKLPVSPPPLPRPDDGGTPGRVPVYTAQKKPSRHTMSCNCGDHLRSFLHDWTPCPDITQRACHTCPRTAPVHAPPGWTCHRTDTPPTSRCDTCPST